MLDNIDALISVENQKLEWTEEDERTLNVLRDYFEEQGGRGIDLAEKIDRLEEKRQRAQGVALESPELPK
jgi:ferritin